MTSEFDKEYLPTWCEGCNQQGYIFVDNIDGYYFVTCKVCGWETSQVSCPKCQMGGGFVMNISERPSSWICPECKTKYELSFVFYENPVFLFTEEILPQYVRERIEKDFQSANNPWQVLKSIFFGLLVIFGLIAIGLLPMLLVFTPLPWTIPGFITTLLIFIMWWWLIGKVLKVAGQRFAMRNSQTIQTSL